MQPNELPSQGMRRRCPCVSEERQGARLRGAVRGLVFLGDSRETLFIEGMHAWTTSVCAALCARQNAGEVPRRERAEIAIEVSFRVKAASVIERA